MLLAKLFCIHVISPLLLSVPAHLLYPPARYERILDALWSSVWRLS